MYSLTMDLKEDQVEYKKQVLLEKFIAQQKIQSDPNSYEGQMNIAEDLHNQCIKNDTLCGHALLQLTFLIEQFPNKIRPLELRSKLHLKLNDTISSRNDVVTISKIREAF
jgi:hypothetical protein